MRIACRLVISFAMAFSLTASAATKEVVELGQRLERLKESIRLTKERLKRPQDVEFLPDLYFMMAELLIESSRVAISLKQAKQPKTPIDELDFTAEKRPKLEAIEIYRQIEGRFPKYAKLDKVLFFQAHEHRELGQADEALALYKKIVDQYPGSAHWDEAQLNIGNHYFEKKDFDFALEQYQKIIAKERSKAAAAAYYKMGWCHVNKGKWVESLDSYRKSVDAFTNIAGQFKPTDIKNADMREEALVASVWPYTELKPEEVLKIPDAVTPVKFYRGLAPDKFVYARVMSRLGRRLVIKKRFSDAATAHLEALKSLEDPVARMDALEDYYRAFKETKDEFFPAGISGVVAETFIWLNELERDLKPQQRRTTKYEPIFRDIATSMHKAAMSTKRAEDLLQAARAYEDYLFIYPKSKYRAAMSTNLAESYYHAGRKVEAAEIYRALAKKTKDARRSKEHISAMIQSLVEALADSTKLSPLEKHRGRANFKVAAAEFKKRYPADKMNLEVAFNLSKVLYDERDFKKAVPSLREFIAKYGRTQYGEQASLLLLDCFYQQDRMKELLAEGRNLSSGGRLPASAVSRITQVMQEAQLKRVRSVAGDFNTKGYADKMLSLSKSEDGKGVAEPALYEAFLSYKSAGDPKVFDVGSTYVARFPQNDKSKAILTTLAQMALMATDFSRAAMFLETFAMRYKNDPQAPSLAEQAMQIYRSLGQYNEAAQLANQFGRSEQAMRYLAEGRQWGKLGAEAGKLSGSSSLYYHGLSLMRSGKPNEGMQMMNRLVPNLASLPDKDMQGHVLYLKTLKQLADFRSIGKGVAVTPKLIKEKVGYLGQIEQTVQASLATGAGRWIVAGLGQLGKAQAEMENYLKTAPPPPGMNPAQFRTIMEQQSQQYAANANGYFAKCIQVANDNEVVSQFLNLCLTRGERSVDELNELAPFYRSTREQLSASLMTTLMKNPRSVPELRKRLSEAKAGQLYGVAELVLGRIIEIEGDSAPLAAEMGWLYLDSKQYQRAHDQFAQAAKKAGDTETARWGQASLYLGLGLAKKFDGVRAGLKSSRAPASVSHPWLSEAQKRK